MQADLHRVKAIFYDNESQTRKNEKGEEYPVRNIVIVYHNNQRMKLTVHGDAEIYNDDGPEGRDSIEPIFVVDAVNNANEYVKKSIEANKQKRK